MNLQDTPQTIREYFGSEKITSIIRAISQNIGISRTYLLADVLFNLETKNIHIKILIQNIIEKLEIDEKQAKTVCYEIKKRVLEPIKFDLMKWGIDINELNVVNAEPLEQLEQNDLEKIEKKISLDILNRGRNEKETSEKLTIKTESEKEKPLILHVEKTFAPEEKSKKTFKGFSLPFKFFKSKQTQEPVKADVETSLGLEKNEELIKKITPKAEDKKRVVHYSEFRTPLTPFGETGEIVDLEKLAKKDELFPAIQTPIEEKSEAKTSKPVLDLNLKKENIAEKPATPATQKSAIKPQKNPWSFNLFKKTDQSKTDEPEIKKTEPQPKIEGNTIDLRK